MQTANRHIEFNETAVKLDPAQTRHGAPVMVEGAASRYYKLSAAPYGGRLEAEGTIYAEPWAYCMPGHGDHGRRRRNVRVPGRTDPARG
jgi:hypothetical protein